MFNSSKFCLTVFILSKILFQDAFNWAHEFSLLLKISEFGTPNISVECLLMKRSENCRIKHVDYLSNFHYFNIDWHYFWR